MMSYNERDSISHDSPKKKRKEKRKKKKKGKKNSHEYKKVSVPQNRRTETNIRKEQEIMFSETSLHFFLSFPPPFRVHEKALENVFGTTQSDTICFLSLSRPYLFASLYHLKQHHFFFDIIFF